MGLLILNVPPKVNAWLDEQAHRADMKKDDLALKLLKEAADTDQHTERAPTSGAGTRELLRDFEQWCLTRPIRTGHPVDDSPNEYR
jgi:hypothetical protein